jgi:excisionase family DNA binding protein
MDGRKFLSPREYAARHGVSKMQVTRLIKVGRIPALKVGRDWAIPVDIESVNQIGLEKTTSLQKWNKIIKEKFKRSLRIEESKDRELVYSRLHGLGLPHERCLVFQLGRFPSRYDFEVAVGRLGFPYWISAVPDPKLGHLDRLSKLRIYDIKVGWLFINHLPEKENYKIIVSQYPDNPEFKGTALVSRSGLGIAEFITGDRHYILSRGFTLTDPMIFDQELIRRFSKTIPPAKQKKLYGLLRGIYGHLELQYGIIDHKKSITFLDYNDEDAYIEIEEIWADLVAYFRQKKRKLKRFLYGLPASPGKAVGRCVVVHHESAAMFEKVERGDIIISDTTTPEMTSLMRKVSAIVTDLGGITCHAAIVCRELKIPAVVGVGQATDRLRTGDKIRVDADKGEIEILK